MNLTSVWFDILNGEFKNKVIYRPFVPVVGEQIQFAFYPPPPHYTKIAPTQGDGWSHPKIAPQSTIYILCPAGLHTTLTRIMQIF
jgi:hypothetical protein